MFVDRLGTNINKKIYLTKTQKQKKIVSYVAVSLLFNCNVDSFSLGNYFKNFTEVLFRLILSYIFSKLTADGLSFFLILGIEYGCPTDDFFGFQTYKY